MSKSQVTRRQALAVPFLAGLASPLLGKDTRPNILFILVDDLRYNAVGYAGHPFVKTPNIDRIAREGAIFENAFVTTPLCSPSRASFLTGRYVRSHGVLDNTNHNELSHQLITWPRLLHDAGYETAWTGKWHMGTDSTPRPGFDRWVSFRGQGQYNDPLLNIDGTESKVNGYITDLLTDYAVDFLKKSRTKPFVLYLSHKAVHGPFTPAERHKDLFTNETITRTPNAQDNWDGKPALQRDVNGQPPVKGPGSNDELIKNQLRCVTSIDEGIGKVLKALEETGQLDNTLVVFTSDNGYFWGEHHLGDKRWPYEEALRIPMAMRYPKLIKAGSKVKQLVMNVDMAPTMLTLGGGKLPPELQGTSVLPLFKGPVKNWRTSFLSEYFQEKGNPRAPSWQAVRDEQWKYVHYTELNNADELYDLKKDPYEMQNMIHDAPVMLGEKKTQLDKYNQQIK
jgi:arylsulfatase A-like enzyme